MGTDDDSMAPQPELHPYVPSRPAGHLPSPPRRIPVHRADVLVLGTGVAGLSAALAAAEDGAHVMCLSKGGIAETNTRYAQGGLAAALGADDRPEFHAGDTVTVGCGLSDPRVVNAITGEAPAAVRWLRDLGMQFDLGSEGDFDLGREGGHRLPRVLHAGGTATGLELQRVLGGAARQQRGIDLFEHITAVDFLRDADGRVCAVLALSGSRESTTARPVIFEARSIVLASGGGGQIFRETTNPPNATGDGLAMALRAGAVLQDLEFVQFHPTILYLAGAARFLISEVTRGAGGVLRDQRGHAFMAEYHPDGELAPRDVVSRAIYRQMLETGGTNVYLDLTGVPQAATRFPALARITGQFGLDVARAPIPVRPAVHYFVGGVKAGLDGRTSLEGLWATGECASICFHGANRMGSNSLLEGLVHGRKVGRDAAASLSGQSRRFLLPIPAPRAAIEGAELNLTDMTYSLKSMMWRSAGIEREAAGLSEALNRLSEWEGYLDRLAPLSRAGVEVINMVQVGRAIAHACTFRRESRGTHFRSDYPETLSEWQVHSQLLADAGGLSLQSSPAAAAQAIPHAPPSAS